ncbi:hypothetical protein LXL04_010426 [Taraxacum kok-saghyz]
MEQGYKHFSHSHNLVMHQLPDGVDVSCSGCNSSGTGTVYVCWLCNFFLHEQCYRATRSFKHPSHPPHPLTLVPYPTYPSNSFYCNSCEIIGTGLSYSCASCEFDLHVQCAYSISRATSFQNTHQYPTNYYNPDHQEHVPSNWNGQNPSVAHNAPSVSVPDNLQPPAIAPQNTYVDPNAHSVSIPNHNTGGQYHHTGHDVAYVSIPPVHQNSDANFAQNPSTIEDLHSLSVPSNPPIPIANAQYPSMAQTGSSVSNPTIAPNLVTSTGDSSKPQYVPSVSIPATSPNYQPDNLVESVKNQTNRIGSMHFSHPHKLRIVNLQDEDKEIECSGCKDTLEGTIFSCVEPNCNFHLHESCFFLKRAILHDSHPPHPLELLPSAPYNNKNGEFTCNACFSDGTGFTYHCSICKYDLHIQCVNLPETVKRGDHVHVLKLHYSCPVKEEEYTFSCDVCHVDVQEDRWTYYCEECDYGTHLGCVDCEECVEDSLLVTQMQLQNLQFQLALSRQNAEMFASLATVRG